ncbi:centriole and centriolar satellite protein ofd1 [Chanos chanos]|uniref:Centriole and centriolar satellite protein ofd1 n=1 Tax=Chanos chanos TaxID=29144 RepID=A0A6J2WDW4_CHACN|nr:oral-facial-digital syndrome 1 protein [Chanos chanos]
MSISKEESLSSDELRKKLYQTFRNRGVLDTLKTQLRNQLIQELKHPVLSGEAVPRPVPVNADSVLVAASNSLIVEHLRSSGYEYTLSVFYPECGMSKEKVFSTRDLLQLLRVSPSSPLYKSLTSNLQRGQKGFLMNFLTELSELHLHREHCDADTQTHSSSVYRESLVEKMKMIDEEYEVLRSKGTKWESFDAKLAEFKKEIEEQAQAEIKAKLQHFKEMEIAKVRMEEKEKSRKEILELRRDMERTYEMKSEALMSREKNAIERLQKQQEIEEKDIYMQRQALLKDIESFRNRENELKQRMEIFEKNCKLQEEKFKTTEDLLRRRELAVKTMEDTYDQKLKNELTRYQLELKEDYVKRTEKLTENEKRNKAETARIQRETALIEAKAEEHNKTVTELKRVQMELSTTQSQASLLSQQNELLRERLETMNDYATLKREKVELQAQVRLLKNQLEEVQQENHRLHQDLRLPSQEQLALQAELRRLETARQMDQDDFQNQKQLLNAQLQQEMERCAQLKSQLMECEERTQWMNAHAEEIKRQLLQTQHALENEVLRNPKPSLVDRSVLELNPDKLVPPDIYVDTAVFPGRGAYDGIPESEEPPRGRRQHWARSVSPDSDTELITGALSRIRELEKEAETLEEAYRNYQQRAVQATISTLLPPPQPRYASKAAPLAPPRVTFAPNRTRLPVVRPERDRNGTQAVDFSREQTHRDGGSPPRASSPPLRRLSSTPLSISKKLPRPMESPESPALSFAGLSPERQISPIPTGGAVAFDRLSDNTSPPSSPRLKSTARDHCSPPKLQEVLSSSSQESSPQPEKISIQDLTELAPVLSSEILHVPAQLQDQDLHLPEETPTEPTPIYVHRGSEEPGGRDKEEEEEEEDLMKWELERKSREERRQREREEAQERERRELERLEQERLLEEVEYEEVVKAEKSEIEESEKEGLREFSQDGREEEEEVEESRPPRVEKVSESEMDPLQRYMRMVMQGGASQQEQSSRKEEPEKDTQEEQSPEALVLSDEKDDSIAAFTHTGADDDDFW